MEILTHIITEHEIFSD